MVRRVCLLAASLFAVPAAGRDAQATSDLGGVHAAVDEGSQWQLVFLPWDRGSSSEIKVAEVEVYASNMLDCCNRVNPDFSEDQCKAWLSAGVSSLATVSNISTSIFPAPERVDPLPKHPHSRWRDDSESSWQERYGYMQEYNQAIADAISSPTNSSQKLVDKVLGSIWAADGCQVPESHGSYLLIQGSCCCPQEEVISTLEDCRSAIDALGIDRSCQRTWTEWVGFSKAKPTGCSVSSQGCLHLNLGDFSRARYPLAPVCKRKSGRCWAHLDVEAAASTVQCMAVLADPKTVGAVELWTGGSCSARYSWPERPLPSHYRDSNFNWLVMAHSQALVAGMAEVVKQPGRASLMRCSDPWPMITSTASPRPSTTSAGELSNTSWTLVAEDSSVESRSFFSLSNPLLHLCYGLPVVLILAGFIYLLGFYRGVFREDQREIHWRPHLSTPIIGGQCFGRADLDQQCPIRIFHSSTASTNAEGRGEDQEHVCAICLAELEVGDEARTLPCPASHIFHAECVEAWLLSKSDVLFSCPLCRHTIMPLADTAGVEVASGVMDWNVVVEMQEVDVAAAADAGRRQVDQVHVEVIVAEGIASTVGAAPCGNFPFVASGADAEVEV